MNQFRLKLIIPSLIWIATLSAALIATALRQLDITPLWPLYLAGLFPALVTLALCYWVQKEWAQILIIFSWAAMAACASAGLGTIPSGILFICPIAIAMLFFREKLLEALIICALIGGLIFYAEGQGYVPEAPFNEFQRLWGEITGFWASFALLFSAMFMAANMRGLPMRGSTATRWREGIEGGLFEFSPSGDLLGANPLGQHQFDLDNIAKAKTLSNLLDFAPEAQEHFNGLVEKARLTSQRQRGRLSWLTMADEIMAFDVWVTPLRMGTILVHTMDRSQDQMTELMSDSLVSDALASDALSDTPSGAISHATELSQNTLSDAIISGDKYSDDKSLFFATVNHELRTPLNAIIGFSDIMRSRRFGPLPGKYAGYADDIYESGVYLLELISDILDHSKMDAGKFVLNYSEFDAVDVIRSAVKMKQNDADNVQVAIQMDIDETSFLPIQADRRALKQIMLNLLSNAIKYSEKGGFVHIGAYTNDESEDDALIDKITFFVRDTGIGMDAQDVDRVTQPYQQGKNAMLIAERGTGLGLNLVKRFTTMHNGLMEIDSVAGRGTEVLIHIPKRDSRGQDNLADTRENIAEATELEVREPTQDMKAKAITTKDMIDNINRGGGKDSDEAVENKIIDDKILDNEPLEGEPSDRNSQDQANQDQTSQDQDGEDKNNQGQDDDLNDIEGEDTPSQNKKDAEKPSRDDNVIHLGQNSS